MPLCRIFWPYVVLPFVVLPFVAFLTLCRFTLCRAFDPLSFDPLSFDPVSFDPLSVNHEKSKNTKKHIKWVYLVQYAYKYQDKVKKHKKRVFAPFLILRHCTPGIIASIIIILLQCLGSGSVGSARFWLHGSGSQG